MTILEQIIKNKKKELVLLKTKYKTTDFERSRFFMRKTVSACTSLKDPARTGIIAEFKRASPSRGIINSCSNVAEVTQGYANAGASVLSVLTDKLFFGGRIGDLEVAREMNSIPVLRKDFIIDEFQILESKAAGADVILLLASVLNKDMIMKLTGLSHSLGMEVIVEVHTPEELNLICDDADMIGVNNRDLRSFKVDTGISLDMAGMIPDKFLKISESGISSPDSVFRLRKAGYDGFLIGELFMATTDPVKAFIEFLNTISPRNAESKSLRID